MKKQTRILSLLLCLMIAASALLCVSCQSEKQATKNDETQEAKEVSFTFTVVDKDGNKTDCPITTNKATLREALADEKLIGETEKGSLVNTVLGVTLDYAKDGAYWGLYIGEDMAMVGVDDIRPEEGAHYSFVYTAA